MNQCCEQRPVPLSSKEKRLGQAYASRPLRGSCTTFPVAGLLAFEELSDSRMSLRLHKARRFSGGSSFLERSPIWIGLFRLRLQPRCLRARDCRAPQKSSIGCTFTRSDARHYLKNERSR